MSDESSTFPSDLSNEESAQRCPHCDSVVLGDAARCLMCGHTLTVIPDTSPSEQSSVEVDVAENLDHEAQVKQETPSPEGMQGEGPLPVVESIMIERKSPITIWLAVTFIIFTALVAIFVLRFPTSASLAFLPTPAVIPATMTRTPTWTPLPSETIIPSASPTITPMPLPTDTLQPPRSHTIVSGETLFGLSLRYGVTVDSIAEANGLAPSSDIQVSQQLIIPWPTATPPLVPVEVAIGDQTIIADPTDCERYEIAGGDTFFGIAARTRVDLQAILAVNRLTEQSILRPGDTICIPTIIRGGQLPPTPGPSPTASATKPPPGPILLYPPPDTDVIPPEGALVLQWVAVKDLSEDEWYMVEVTDLSDIDGHARRGFTRQTSFRVPDTWRPPVEESHVFRWRVSIVQVTGKREDGTFIYTFGGTTSEDGSFTWLGAVPTPTSTPTPTPELS